LLDKNFRQMLGGTRVATSDFVLFLPFLLALDEIIHISWEVVVVESTTGRWIGWVRRGCLLPRGLEAALVFFEGVSSTSSPLRFLPEAGVAGVVVAPDKYC
jgi:hypothetical protein